MHVDVRIQSLEDWQKGPLFPEHVGKPFERIEASHCAILECGTTGGKSSMFISGFDADGKLIALELTGSMFKMIHGVLLGAEQRWNVEASRG